MLKFKLTERELSLNTTATLGRQDSMRGAPYMVLRSVSTPSMWFSQARDKVRHEERVCDGNKSVHG